MQWFWGFPKGQGKTAKAFLEKTKTGCFKIAPRRLRNKRSNPCADKTYSLASLKGRRIKKWEVRRSTNPLICDNMHKHNAQPLTQQVIPLLPSVKPLSTASKKLQSLKVGALLLHYVKATFNYSRRRAGLWLVLVWEMRWTCWPYENEEWLQYWQSLHSRWLLAQRTDGKMLQNHYSLLSM